jgi:hypothetical protein
MIDCHNTFIVGMCSDTMFCDLIYVQEFQVDPIFFGLLISIHSKHRVRILNGSPVYVDPSAPNLGAYIYTRQK